MNEIHNPVGSQDVPVHFPSEAEREKHNHERWERLTHTQLGVNVMDPDSPHIGNARCIRTFGHVPIGGWQPVDGWKHILVGELDHFYFYNPWTSGAEADFNIDISPDPPFRFVLDDVVALMSADERKELNNRRGGPGHVVECEITPDEEYYNNFYFPTKEGWGSPLVGSRIGVYGPWVRDMGHGGRPEIHPCEVIWFQHQDVTYLTAVQGVPPFRVPFVRWTFIVLQDDSNRFDRESDYNAPVHRPWSASPRRASITVALQALRGQHITYSLSLRDGRRVFAWPGEEVRKVTVTTDDQTALTVTKHMSPRAQVKVRVGPLAPDPNDANLLRCFMDMDVQVGEGDRGQEGFAELELEAWAPDNQPSSGSEGQPPHPHPTTTPPDHHRPPGTQEP